jgi:ADP-ribosylglycohydrolase
MMQIPYETYLDKILGGWLGKSIGGAVGARFEGNKGWHEVRPEEMFPEKIPPNDDLDLQVLWLKVLEEKGPALTSDDMAQAWLEWCWYPFNEYGIFRRNWQLGIHPPMSGRFTNQFWESGEGCPIRSEIWGYVFPCAPDLAAKFAWMDGTLDHTEQSVGAEQMLAAMASMAFFVSDVRRLAEMFFHYLPKGTPIERMTRAAFECYDMGLSLKDARARLMAIEGHPEACDSQVNIPFTFLALLYGGNDLQETILAAVRCGYDTDCTAASCGALVGQILGASRIPAHLKRPIKDELVMWIEYNRPEMTISALARDTARMGVLMSTACTTGIEITGAPKLVSLPPTAKTPKTRLVVEYTGLPAAAPGDTVSVTVRIEGEVPENTRLTIEPASGWSVAPATAVVGLTRRSVEFAMHAPADVAEWPMRHLFTARLDVSPTIEYTFGVAGAGLWRFLGAYYDALPMEGQLTQQQRRFQHHFVSLDRPYLPEPDVDEKELFDQWSSVFGRRALVPSYEHEIDPGKLTGLRGPYCAYLSRTVIATEERSVNLVIGNTDSFRVYVNGQLAGEQDEATFWTPINNAYPVTLRAGRNTILIKLLKRNDGFRFTLGIRHATGPYAHYGFNALDWVVDLVDEVP